MSRAIPFIINETYMVLVELSYESVGEPTKFAVVGVVNADTQQEAIEAAIHKADDLFDHVSPGDLRFVAVPARAMKTIPVNVTPKTRESDLVI